ncbi:hypothetical protein BJF83_01320 [Nocardiopsis sp. CNR-923]|nr:hypothetical protein [Nocardiopsis sp. CNR-923]OLT28149.1 hypothetical protein BJF83_01320 [Nocardiopsis sp. CNR-923]
MCAADARPDDTSETYVYDPEVLTGDQRVGDACAVCHAQWPRPRRVLGRLPDGARVFGCHECADIIGADPAAASGHRVYAVR